MKLPLYIAWRYLFAKKSHNVINIISAISAAGMAIGTASLILILSIYNGFDEIIKDNLSDLDPDVLVTVSEGKRFVPDEGLMERLMNAPEVRDVCEILEDNVFITYSGRQGIARIKGVSDSYETSSGLSGHTVEGNFSLHLGDVPFASVGSSFAYSHGIHPRFVDRMDIYYPKSDVPVSVSNPSRSLNTISIRPGSIFSINSETDAELVIIPIDKARELTGCDEDEVSGLEIRLVPGASARKFIRVLELPDKCSALDRYRQHPSLYKMMRYEKLAIFMILIFVVIIIAFNIFGSLSMLIIEKRDDISTLKAMGATDSMTREIFLLEGWLISLAGLAAGLVTGIAAALVQQQFGLVKMPGNYLISAYPVSLEALDIIMTAIGVAAVGFLIALLAVRRNR